MGPEQDATGQRGRPQRTEDGRAYRVGFPPRAVAFDLRIYDVDLPATIAAYLEHASKRREAGKARAKREK